MMHQFPQGNPTLPDHMRNPFGDVANGEALPDPWLWENVERSRYVMEFERLHPIDGKVSGATVKPVGLHFLYDLVV